MRSSNPLEERSLGIHAENEEIERPKDHWWYYIVSPSQSDMKFLWKQLQVIQAYDCYIVISATFIILVSEMFAPASSVGIFDVLLEVVSAYRNVGVSMGVPSDGYSFSGSWNVSRNHPIMCFTITN